MTHAPRRTLALILCASQLIAAQAAAGTATPPDSARFAALSRRLSHAESARIDTRDLRFSLYRPRADASGIAIDSLLAPVPTDAAQLPRVLPWTEVQELEVRGHKHLPMALGVVALGGLAGHIA